MTSYLRAHDLKTGKVVSLVPEHTDLTVQLDHAGPGGLSFKIETDAPGAKSIMTLPATDDLYFTVLGATRATEDPLDQWFLLDDDGDDMTQNEGRLLSVSATELPWALLSETVVHPRDYVVGMPSTELSKLPQEREWKDRTVGYLLNLIFNEAQARGAMPGITWTFDGFKDSAGADWPRVEPDDRHDITMRVGESYADILHRMIAAGWCDVRTAGKEIQVYMKDSPAVFTDRPEVVLRAGQNLINSPRKRTRRGVANHILGAGGPDKLMVRQDADSIAASRRREGFISDGSATTLGTLHPLLRAELKTRKKPRESITVKFLVDDVREGEHYEGTAMPTPGSDFKIGDTIRYDARPSASGLEPLRILTMTWELSPSSGDRNVSVELNDVFLGRGHRVARQVGSIIGGGGSIATPPPAPRDPSGSWVDSTVPAAATDVVVTAGAFTPVDATGFGAKPVPTATVTWVDPGVNTDGSDLLDARGVEVHGQVDYGPGGLGSWLLLDRVDMGVMRLVHEVGQAVASRYRVTVADTYGHRSDVVETAWVPAGGDTAPPAKPAPPTVTTEQGGVYLTHDWDDTTGQPLAVDTSHLRIKDGDGAVLGRLSIPGSKWVDVGGHGEQRTYTVTAVDTSGNESVPSDPVTVTVVGLVDADLIGTTITENVEAANTRIDDLEQNVIPSVQAEVDAVTALTLQTKAAAGQVWPQPTAPPAGTIHRWAGTADASASEQVDGGTVTARNYVWNPGFRRLDPNLTDGTVDGWSPSYSAQKQVILPDGETVLESTNGVQPTADILLFSNGGTSGGLFPAPEVGYYAATFEVRSLDGPFTLSNTHLRHYPSDGSAQRQLASASISVTNEWQKVNLPAINDVLVANGHVRFLGYCPPSGGWAPGMRVQIRRLRVEKVPVGESITDYFDGSSADDRARDLWIDTDDGNKPYMWDGTGNGWAPASDAAIAAAKSTADQALARANAAVTQSVVEYAVHSSETTAPTSGWSTATPSRDPGTFIWYRTLLTYGDGTTSTSSPALLTGNTGATGSTGVGISSVTPYYKQQAATAAAPAKPTTNPPDASWVTTEPAYASLTVLYRTERVVYSNGAFAYTTPSRSSSYDAAKAVEDRALSRGTDLVTNGTGYLRNNYNFSWSEFTAADAPVGANGSFLVPLGSNASRLSDELIPVDTAKMYQLTASARQTRADAPPTRAYTGLAPYDAAGASIGPVNYMYREGTTTTLTQELKPGDTVIHVASTAGWNQGPTSTWRTVIVWNWTDSFGKVWPQHTYSRDSRIDAYAENALTATTIPLKAAWTGQTYPVGTPISNGGSGGSFMYAAWANHEVTTSWVSRSGVYGPGVHNTPLSAATTKFPHGTAAVKLIFLPNRQPTGGAEPLSRHAFAALSLSDAAAAASLAITADNRVRAGTRPPTAADGVGAPVDAIWWQYGTSADPTVTGQVLLAMWKWDGAAWVNAPMDRTVIPLLDIGTGTFGDLDGIRLKARSVVADSLAVLPANMFPDPHFRDEARWELNVSSATADLDSAMPGGRRLTIYGSTVQTGSYYGSMDGDDWVQVEPGEKYRVKAVIRGGGSAPDTMLFALRYTRTDGTRNSAITTLDLQAAGARYAYAPVQAVIAVPADAKPGGMANVGFFTASPYDSGASIYVGGVELVRQASGILIEDGAITAPHITASESLSAKVGSFLELQAANFKADLIEASYLKNLLVLEGKRLVAGDAAGQATELNDSGLEIWETGPDGTRNPDPSTRLGKGTTSMLTMSNIVGDPIADPANYAEYHASINNEAVISGEGLVVNNDPSFGGRLLMGAWANRDTDASGDRDSFMWNLPWGLVGEVTRLNVISDHLIAYAGTNQMLAYDTVNLLRGRAYRFWFSPVHVNITGRGSSSNLILRLYKSQTNLGGTPSIPPTGADIVGYRRYDASYASPVAIDTNFMIQPNPLGAADETANFAIGLAALNCDASIDPTYQSLMYCEDIGPSTGYTGGANYPQSSDAPTVAPTKKYTYYFYPSSLRQMQGAFTSSFYWGGKGQGDKMIQGWNSSMSAGPYHTHARWANAAYAGSGNISLASATAGATQIKAYLRVTSAFSSRSSVRGRIGWAASDVSSPTTQLSTNLLSPGAAHEVYLGAAGSQYVKDNAAALRLILGPGSGSSNVDLAGFYGMAGSGRLRLKVEVWK